MSRLYRPNPEPAWRLDAAQSGGGLFLDVGSHVLDLLDHLLGPFVEFGGSAATQRRDDAVEDVVAMHFRTAERRRASASASWNFAASYKHELLEIDGTEGRLSMEVLGWSPIR